MDVRACVLAGVRRTGVAIVSDGMYGTDEARPFIAHHAKRRG